MKATYCIATSIIINFDDYIVFFLAFIRKIRYKYYKCVFLEWGKERGTSLIETCPPWLY